MTKRTKITSSIAILAILAVGVIYWAASSGASSGLTEPKNTDNPVSQAVASKEHPAAQLASISSDQARFSSLAAGGSGFPSTLAASISGGPTAAEYGLNLNLARSVSASGDAWLIPGNGELCLWLTDSNGKSGGLVCSTTAKALTGGLSQSRMNEAGVQHIVGIVPDGTTSVTLDGKSVAITGNSWEAVSGPEPTTATVTTDSGSQTVDVP